MSQNEGSPSVRSLGTDKHEEGSKRPAEIYEFKSARVTFLMRIQELGFLVINLLMCGWREKIPSPVILKCPNYVRRTCTAKGVPQTYIFSIWKRTPIPLRGHGHLSGLGLIQLEQSSEETPLKTANFREQANFPSRLWQGLANRFSAQ